jgi:hypothetical protein
MCRYSIFAVYRLCGMLVVIVVDVQLQNFCCVPFVWDVGGYCSGCAVIEFLLCTVCVGCWWLL